MDFYHITQNQDGYYLGSDDQPSCAISLTQFGFIMERLSDLFKKQQMLPLKIRTYITLYYDNGQTEYISLKSMPSKLIQPIRTKEKFGIDTLVDGFATTFLKGDEENRVWIGMDGAIENRGINSEAVRVLLSILLEALNADPAQAYRVFEKHVQNLDAKWLLRLLNYLKEHQNYFEPLLDLNHAEVDWLSYQGADGQWKDCNIAAFLMLQPLPCEVTVDLLHHQGLYQLVVSQASESIRLIQLKYPWQEEQADEQLIDRIKNLLVMIS